VIEADLGERIGEVRRRLALDGPPWTRAVDGDFDRVAVPERDCDRLRDLLITEGVGTVVEIGLAYGSSALAIGEALLTVSAPRPQHIIIDPVQDTEWRDVGWQLLRSAGLDPIAELIRQPSSMALPQLVANRFTADEAFVDGSHRFHEVFVDLYFLRKIVRPGGLIIVDDYGWPSVHAAVRYNQTNMGWRVVHGAFDGGTIDNATKQTRAQALRLPDPAFEPAFDQFQPFQ
jgi:predicted O-methyltransferase YrrM